MVLVRRVRRGKRDEGYAIRYQPMKSLVQCVCLGSDNDRASCRSVSYVKISATVFVTYNNCMQQKLSSALELKTIISNTII